MEDPCLLHQVSPAAPPLLNLSLPARNKWSDIGTGTNGREEVTEAGPGTVARDGGSAVRLYNSV